MYASTASPRPGLRFVLLPLLLLAAVGATSVTSKIFMASRHVSASHVVQDKTWRLAEHIELLERIHRGW
ncbi:hypothetical protein G3580_05115 [Nitrogeniibacter mangrovi]|uniref:Uncharacterized protein n=1 Tax=Nitrogeniibacter mangrovi TaxID=2016596 RepID=A0A6C1B138_9RHOO|nr:hypothetical protein [Nitrogeniibacter mangrovi]QID17073.1 hypothetical protein G3580_05115 [Nitrogeniibacter mangrovi]